MIKILQFEPWLWNDLTDYPDLGAAMLMGAYAQHGIEADLICTQNLCVEGLFTEYLEESIGLFMSLTPEEQGDFPTLLTLGDLKSQLSDLYKRYYSGRWQDYFDTTLSETFRRVFLDLVKLQFLYLKSGKNVPIAKILIEYIKSSDYGLICVSFYNYDERNQLLLGEIRKHTKSPICIGGAFTGHLKNEDIEALQKMCPADYLSVGPGEKNLIELKGYLDSNGQLEIPDNIIPLYEGGKYTLKCEPIGNLNDYQGPDFSKSRVDKYPSPAIVLPVQSARGCTWRKCTFCSHHKGYYGEYHTLSIENVTKRIKDLRDRYGCKFFVLHDDDIPARRLIQIGEELKRQNVDVNIMAYTRADSHFLGQDVFSRLYECGFRAFSWGIESGSQKILDEIKKGISIEEAANILKLSNENGISNTCWLMINIPGEDESDFEDTMRFIVKNAPYVDLWLTSPFRMQYDSPMFEEKYRNENTKRVPFATSMPLTKEQERVEIGRSERINNLLSSGIFDSNAIPPKNIPHSCQRARIVPMLYRSSIKVEEIGNESFQLVLNCKALSLGKNLILRNENKKRTLDQKQKSIYERLMSSVAVEYSALTEEEARLCSELIADELCKAYYVNASDNGEKICT